MNPRRVVAIARKSMSQFRHDRRTIGFVVGMPLLMIIAFGYTFGGQVSHVRTLVVNEDAGPLAGFLLENITGDSLDLEPFADLGSARAQVEGADAWAILYFPASFTADLARRNASIVVLLDGTNPPIVAAVLGTVRAAVEKTFAGSGGGTALTLDQEFVYGNADTRFIDSFAPGIVGLAVLLVTTVFSVIIIVREKSGGMLERLFATPLRPGELVLGHALSLGVIAFFLLTEHTAHAFGVLPYLLLLLCPLLHLFMHGRHGDHSEHSPQGAPMDRQEEQSSGEDE